MSNSIDLAMRLQASVNEYFLKLIEKDVSRMDFQPPDGKWSGKETLGHLIDSAANNHQRFVRTQLKDDMIFDGYDQDAWVKTQNYQNRAWIDVVNLWHQYNNHLIHIIKNITDEVLNRKYKQHNLDQIAFKTIPKSKHATLAYFITDYIDHMIYHLEEIVKI